MSTLESDVIECVATAATGGETPRASTPGSTAPRSRIDTVLTGTLLGFRDDGRTPLVIYPGQPGTAAIEAASTIDLHGGHVGRQLALLFEHGDPKRPLVIGLLRQLPECAIAERPGQVEVDADGERLIVTAREQLVLRCGKASITLTKSGKVLIQGEYVSSRSGGVHRIRGGSVQIN